MYVRIFLFAGEEHSFTWYHSILSGVGGNTAAVRQPRHLKSPSRLARRRVSFLPRPLAARAFRGTTEGGISSTPFWNGKHREARNLNGPLFLSRQLKLLPSFPEHCPQRIVSSRAVIVSSPLYLPFEVSPSLQRLLLLTPTGFLVRAGLPGSSSSNDSFAVRRNICLHRSSDSFSLSARSRNDLPGRRKRRSKSARLFHRRLETGISFALPFHRG